LLSARSFELLEDLSELASTPKGFGMASYTSWFYEPRRMLGNGGRELHLMEKGRKEEARPLTCPLQSASPGQPRLPHPLLDADIYTDQLLKTSVNPRFNRLAWGSLFKDRPRGLLAAGMETGELSIYDPDKVLAGARSVARSS